MCMQNRARATLFYDPYVQQRLVGRLTTVLADDASILINRQYLLRSELTLVDPTRTHRDPQRLTLDHRAKIPTRPQQPPARMKPLRHRRQLRGNLRDALCHEKMLTRMHADALQRMFDVARERIR